MGDEGPNGYLSTLYHSLRTQRRRRAIRYLNESDAPTITVRELARKIAADEHGLPLTHATGEPYRNAYNALSQTHLPTLVAAGIVIYDPKRQIVSKGPNFQTAALLVAINTPVVQFLQTDDSGDEDGERNR